MRKIGKLLTTLTFEGPRFEDHGLDLDSLPELIAYKKLLIDTAKELWHQQHPDRQRLPRGFEETISIKFYELKKGSTSVPLYREIAETQPELPFDLEDEIDRAAAIIEEGIDAQGYNRSLPDHFPKHSFQLFEGFGKSLKEGEAILILSSKRERAARYTLEIRDKFIQWHKASYEDNVELHGEVRAADLDGLNFTLRLADGTKVSGKFDLSMETQIIEALKEHKTLGLRVSGIGRFSGETGALEKIAQINSISVRDFDRSAIAKDVPPIWETILSLSAEIPEDEWRKVPDDLAINLDKYLYGNEEDKLK